MVSPVPIEQTILYLHASLSKNQRQLTIRLSELQVVGLLHRRLGLRWGSVGLFRKGTLNRRSQRVQFEGLLEALGDTVSLQVSRRETPRNRNYGWVARGPFDGGEQFKLLCPLDSPITDHHIDRRVEGIEQGVTGLDAADVVKLPEPSNENISEFGVVVSDHNSALRHHLN